MIEMPIFGALILYAGWFPNLTARVFLLGLKVTSSPTLKNLQLGFGFFTLTLGIRVPGDTTA